MLFSEIPGHEDTKRRLREMADGNKLPHALMLEGQEGIGKFALIRAFAQYINCTGRMPGDTDSCGNCPSCHHYASMTHIDTLWIYPVVKLEKMKTPPTSDDFHDEWMDYLDGRIYMDMSQWTDIFDKKNAVPTIYVTESDSLIRKLSFASHTSRYKIVLWWLPERMNVETANKLLKIIEEPYQDTIFLMTANNPAQILPTVYSRVQRIKVTPYPETEVAQILTSRYALPIQDAEEIARLSHGSMSSAIGTISVNKRKARMFEMFKQLMRLAYQRNVIELRQWAADLAATGREQQLEFYSYAVRLIRENFVKNFAIDSLVYMDQEEWKFGNNFSRFICERNVEQLAGVFNSAITDIAANGNGKIINLDVALKVIVLLIPPKS